MRRIIPFILIFCLAFRVIPVNAPPNEGYGEDSDALGQYVDSYIDMTGISVNISVERNATLDAIELNFTAGSGLNLVNFSTFTEVDEDGDVTVFDYNISWDTMRRDAETYVNRSYGAGYWGDFIFNYQLNITDVEAGDITAAGVAFFAMLTNETGVVDDLTQYLGVRMEQNQATDDEFRLRLQERKASANVFLSPQQIVHSINDPLFITVNRSGADVTLSVYNTSARLIGDLIQQTTQTGNGDVYEYLFGLDNWGRDVDPADHHTGYLRNLDTGGTADAYDASGYVISIDYLSDPAANGSTLVSVQNTSIPTNTQITIQFSPDNSTWVNHLGVAGSDTLVDGWNAIPLMDLNYSSGYYEMKNLSTTDTSITPRIYQSRVITTEGNQTGAAAPGAAVAGANWWIIIGIISIPVAVYIGVKKR